MTKLKDQKRIGKLLSENRVLRAKLLAAHDLLHNDKLDELHEVLHCDSCEQAEQVLSGMNVTIGQGDYLARFATAFNRLCTQQKILASWTALLPSATKLGYTSIQMGGCVEVIQ